MIALGALLVLAMVGVAVPNYVRPPGRKISAKNECIANLKQIDGAAQQWALANSKSPADSYAFTNPAVLRFLKGSVLPRCPSGGKYSAAPNLGDAPTCTIPGHTL